MKKIKKYALNPFLISKAIKNKSLYFYRLYISRDENTIAFAKWFRDKGDLTLRLDYPLNSESIVFDLGGYKGDFAADIHSKYGCHVFIFEPVTSYYLECVSRFKNNNKIKCFNYGLSDQSGDFLIGDDGDRSSLIKNYKSAACERVAIKSFSEELSTLGVGEIDLLKINIEGPEFLILADIISKNLVLKINHLQVQFHKFFPNSVPLRNEIRAGLSKTHDEIWNYPFVWESWSRRN